MKKLMRVLIVLGSLVGICSTVRGGENNEEVNESIDRIRIIGWYLLYSKMVERLY